MLVSEVDFLDCFSMLVSEMDFPRLLRFAGFTELRHLFLPCIPVLVTFGELF